MKNRLNCWAMEVSSSRKHLLRIGLLPDTAREDEEDEEDEGEEGEEEEGAKETEDDDECLPLFFLLFLAEWA